MIEIEGIERVVKTFDDMLHKVRTLSSEADAAFFNWQAEEVHRKHPSVHHAGDSAHMYSVFRPHSRREMLRSKHVQRRYLRAFAYQQKHPRSKRQLPHVQPHSSTRPILRPGLLEGLGHRLQAVMAKLRWA